MSLQCRQLKVTMASLTLVNEHHSKESYIHSIVYSSFALKMIFHPMKPRDEFTTEIRQSYLSLSC